MTEGGLTKPRYIMLGGFLGAGKTTAAARLAEYLAGRGLRVGIICNDQSRNLVDTTVLRHQGFEVQEITGGCFCCRFNSLVEAVETLTAKSRPDVFVAEPVGSCTDLIATVSYPLRRIYGDRYTVAPLSVLLDPMRAARIFGLTQGRSFSEEVVYVYRKQLEEADLIVVNKCDVFLGPMRQELVASLQREFPRAEVLCCSAREENGLNDWFERLLAAECEDAAPVRQRSSLPVEQRSSLIELNYDRYAEGEALLGWLNATAHVAVTPRGGRPMEAGQPFDGDALLLDLAHRIRAEFSARSGEIAHLKMTLDAADHAGDLSAISLVSSDAEPDLRESLLKRTTGGSLIINLRAEADPETLRSLTEKVLNDCARLMGEVTINLQHLECFRPARPAPTHRMSVAP